jgi:hypothetical protein
MCCFNYLRQMKNKYGTINMNHEQMDITILHVCIPRSTRSKSRLGLMDNLNQEFYIGFKVLKAVVMRSSIFWDIPPCSPLKVNRLFRRNISPPSSASTTKLCLPPTFTLVSFLSYSSNLRMEEICSSETSVNFQRITLYYIPEDSALQAFYVSLICPAKARRV